jgi:cell division septation protein DedD
MESRRRRRPTPFKEAMSFWLIVMVLATAAAAISFRVGRDWLGRKLSSVEVSGGAPRIVAQTKVDPEEAARAEVEAKAPANAVVTTEDRAPTDPERQKIESDQALKEPQDGAQLNQSKAKPDKSAGDDDTGAASGDKGSTKSASAPAKKGKYVVTAGSYADEANASRVLAKLAAKGYSPYMETVHRGGKTLHRVNVAEVRDRDRAEEMRDELAGSGIAAGISGGD